MRFFHLVHPGDSEFQHSRYLGGLMLVAAAEKWQWFSMGTWFIYKINLKSQSGAVVRKAPFFTGMLGWQLCASCPGIMEIDCWRDCQGLVLDSCADGICQNFQNLLCWPAWQRERLQFLSWHWFSTKFFLDFIRTMRNSAESNREKYRFFFTRKYSLWKHFIECADVSKIDKECRLWAAVLSFFEDVDRHLIS